MEKKKSRTKCTRSFQGLPSNIVSDFLVQNFQEEQQLKVGVAVQFE